MFCPDCLHQEEFCRCPMRRQDALVLLVIFVALLAYVVWSSLHPRAHEQQGYRATPPAVRQVPPPRPPRACA